MDRKRAISELILSRHPEAFSSDFEKNKKSLEDLAFVSSKQLRNHIAGYLAKVLKEEETREEAPPSEEIKE